MIASAAAEQKASVDTSRDPQEVSSRALTVAAAKNFLEYTLV